MPPNPPGPHASLDDWLRWQEALHPQAIALGLERVRAVAAALKLPASGVRTLTIAGTNGKGSSTVLASEIYRAAGYRVGTYTSPHLLRYNERVAVGGREASDADLVRAFAAVEAVRGGVPLTYFEYGTLAALWLFREAAVQVQVLEVGLGGRLDAVNLVDPDVALITNIGLDHVEFLGKDREQIAFEKAGILRAATPAVCADPEPPAAIARRAAELGAPLWQFGTEYRYQLAADAWNWQGPGLKYKKLPPPALVGAAQLRNAAGVIAAVARLRGALPVEETAIRAALVRLRLPGRFDARTWRDARGRTRRLVLDVAHNVEAARVLAENLSASGARQCKLVVGMLSDKPVEGFLEALAPWCGRLYLGGLPPPRGLSGAALAGRAGAQAAGARVFDTVEEAFAHACADGEGDLIVVCGSFLTVAAVARRLAHG